MVYMLYKLTYIVHTHTCQTHACLTMISNTHIFKKRRRIIKIKNLNSRENLKILKKFCHKKTYIILKERSKKCRREMESFNPL